MIARKRPLRVMYSDRPLVRAFPRLWMTVMFLAALARLVGAGMAAMWSYRRELAAVTLVCGAWSTAADAVPGWWSLLVTLAVVAGLLSIGPVRRFVAGWLACGRTRRRLLAAFAQTRSGDLDGRLPRVVRVRRTPIGERLWLRLRPGQSFEQLDPRTEEFRAAVRSRDVRLTRDENRSHRVTVDVVRRDTLTGAPVAWADHDADVLSMWDPVSIGESRSWARRCGCRWWNGRC